MSQPNLYIKQDKYRLKCRSYSTCLYLQWSCKIEALTEKEKVQGSNTLYWRSPWSMLSSVFFRYFKSLIDKRIDHCWFVLLNLWCKLSFRLLLILCGYLSSLMHIMSLAKCMRNLSKVRLCLNIVITFIGWLYVVYWMSLLQCHVYTYICTK